jgi:two-component system response regulator YesN
MIPIMISGHDNFEFAQQAIRFNVVDYLLKPFGEEQLKSALNRAMNRLSLLQPVHDYVLQIQDFIDRMGQMDYPLLAKHISSLIKSIYDAKKMDKKARVSLLRILSGKMLELMPDLEADPNLRPQFSDVSDFDQILNYFIMLAEFWMQKRSQPESKFILQKVCSYLSENYMNNISVGDMAKYASLSPSHFRYLFKQHTGTTFVNYLNGLRIDKAKVLLLEDDLKIYEVCEMTGFVSQPYFNRMFKEKTDMTPAEYRKRAGL